MKKNIVSLLKKDFNENKEEYNKIFKESHKRKMLKIRRMVK